MRDTTYNYDRFRANIYTSDKFPGSKSGEKAIDFVSLNPYLRLLLGDSMCLPNPAFASLHGFKQLSRRKRHESDILSALKPLTSILISTKIIANP